MEGHADSVHLALAMAQGVRPYSGAGKGRLQLTLAPDDEPLAVARERAAAFKAWWERAPAASGG